MKAFVKLLFAGFLFGLLSGCAHPINMKPDLDALKAQAIAPIEKKIGYYISDASRALEVTTSAGGGDQVRYFPYRDIEPGFYKALSDIFTDVSKIKNPNDANEIRTSGISILIAPEVTTASSSSNPFAWPPTRFAVVLACTITDTRGRLLRKVTVTGEGEADFGELTGNYSLTAVRAANDALMKLKTALGAAPEVRN